MNSANLRKPLKNKEHWISEARMLCCDTWQFPAIPDDILTDIDLKAAEWDKDHAKKQLNLNSFFKPLPP